MSTNYYLHAPESYRWGAVEHLGKSSQGWCFGLHVYPEERLNNWAAMWEYIEELVYEFNYTIRDEYGRIINPGEFFAIVWNRDVNSRRHELDDRCIGHGNGPFDYIVGDFS
jgi:hypothetical protein